MSPSRIPFRPLYLTDPHCRSTVRVRTELDAVGIHAHARVRRREVAAESGDGREGVLRSDRASRTLRADRPAGRSRPCRPWLLAGGALRPAGPWARQAPARRSRRVWPLSAVLAPEWMSASLIVPFAIWPPVISFAVPATAVPLSATASAIIATIIAGVKRLPFNIFRVPSVIRYPAAGCRGFDEKNVRVAGTRSLDPIGLTWLSAQRAGREAAFASRSWLTMRPARFELATSASAGQRSIP